MAFFSKLMRSTKPRDPRYGSASGNDSYRPNFEDPDSAFEENSSDSETMNSLMEAEDILVEEIIPAENGKKDNRANSKSKSENGKAKESSKTQEKGKNRRAEDKIKPLVNRILSAESTLEVLPTLTNDLKSIFNSESICIYSVDKNKKQLAPRNFHGKAEKEFRLEISHKSLPGYCAASGQTINVVDAYSSKELKNYKADLVHNATWDRMTRTKTRSVLLIAIAHENKPVGVLEIINKIGDSQFRKAEIELAKELAATLSHAMIKVETEEIDEKVKTIGHSIHSAKHINDILLGLKDSLLDVFYAEMVSIYAVDPVRNQIYTKTKSGTLTDEIRVPLSSKSIAGWVAQENKPINIVDVYNREALAKYDSKLTFDRSWDKKSGQKTKSMLVYPLIHNDRTMGVLQLVNKKNGEKFTSQDQKNILVIADHLGIAFFKQKNAPTDKRLKYGYLVDSGIIPQNDLIQAISKARIDQVNVENILLNELKLKRADIGKALEIYYELPYSGYHESVVLPSQVFAGLNKNYLAKNNWVPIENSSSHMVILIDDPKNNDKILNIKMVLPKKKIEFHVGLKADIRDYLKSGVSTVPEVPIEEEEKNTEELSTLLDALVDEQHDTSVEFSTSDDDEYNAISETDSTIVRLVNKIMTDAYDQGISDIHVEPGGGKKDVKVRFRKDGTCRIYQQIPCLYKQAIISRLKIMARLDIAEKRMPQDGKIKIKYARKDIEYRIATCPTVGGNEDAVLRILASSKPIPLNEMAFSKRNLTLIESIISRPYGLVLVVGPTGSGKTTTLHSCLGHINTPERKIWTAEDPVEITQEGLRQVQMLDKIGLNFARAMRSFLRGDPDVIMVGEMRDTETASIGLEASLTGHLVFSTLHTNSAPETITRLLDMGMNPLNFADAMLLVVAQRLVKILCVKCKEDHHPDKAEFETLVREYGVKDFEKLGIKYSKDLMIKKPVGCQACMDSGYSGRMALHEVLEGTKEMKAKIMHKALVDELRELAKQEGMTTLKQDGIQKIFQGHCDLKQVLTVSSV